MIHIFCALKCEAKPLLDFFKLTHHSPSNLFPVYENQKQEITLTITGIGKLSTAAATIYTHSLFDTKDNDIWLNIGVAGHKDYSIGTLVLANRIEDVDSGKCWYPQIIIDTALQSAGLLSLSQPSTDYCEQMFDMEAAGFYNSVSLFGTAELCHCIKIISDNQNNPANKLSKKDITQLITTNVEAISSLVNTLHTLAEELLTPDISEHYEKFIERWHFSQYEKNQLEQLLRRWHILLPDESPLDEQISSVKQGKEVLKLLAQQLDAAPISYV